MIRSVISLKTNSNKKVNSININNKTESYIKLWLKHLETFLYLAIPRDIDSKIIHTNTSYKGYLQGSLLKSFFLKPATKKEVISVIN